MSNQGQPLTEAERREWEAGYYYGLADNRIQWWQRRHYPDLFLKGYDAGKAELNEAIDEAKELAEFRYWHRSE